MSVTLGGHLFVCRGIALDYCFIEATESLLPVCDKVAVTLFSKEDKELFKAKFSNEPKILLLEKEEKDFDEMPGKERLNYWTTWTKNHLTTDWQFCLQSDEVIHEDSYDAIRHAIEKPIAESYAVRRFNLWGSPYQYLNYPKLIKDGRHGELPCSEYTGRLALIKYDSYGDAESLDAPHDWTYKDAIRTYHCGFIRDKRKKTEHIIRIQEKVFDLGFHDPRTDADIQENDGKFRPYTRFSKEDMLPIYENLPKVIQKWAKERDVE